jgi:hypothetical protein
MQDDIRISVATEERVTTQAAVVLIAFRRPKLTARLAEIVSAANPPKIYLVLDGPRVGRDDDVRRAETEAVFARHWPCPVERLYSSVNLGAKQRIESALDYVFSIEDRAIILEDDTHPVPSFFSFADTMLTEFADEPSVSMISGTNPFGTTRWDHRGFGLSRAFVTWGWATWSDRWFAHRSVPQFDGFDRDTLRSLCGGKHEAKYLASEFGRTMTGELDAWDYPLVWSCIKSKSVAVVPPWSLVQNVGEGDEATNTTTLPFFWRAAARPLTRESFGDFAADPTYRRADRLVDWGRKRMMFPSRTGFDWRVGRLSTFMTTGIWLSSHLLELIE